MILSMKYPTFTEMTVGRIVISVSIGRQTDGERSVKQIS